MDVSSASWLVIILALLLANLPFVNEQMLGFIPFKGRKPFVLRLVELMLLYFVVGGVAYALEAKIGNVFPQTWEFFAITACVFIVLAFPGFVIRYLRKHRH